MTHLDRLSRLQRRVMVTLAALKPQGVVTGGAALVGFYLGHRATRNVNLVFRGTQ
jgi:hypothetical protein